MKLNFLLLIISFFLLSCAKPKTVLICGDHVCVNKTEAEQYFEENLTLEVKIIEKQKKKIDLVELNLNSNTKGKREINIFSKKTTNENLKILSSEEINLIKKKIKEKRKEKKIAKSTIDNYYKVNQNDRISIKEKNRNNKKTEKLKVNKRGSHDNIVDVCTIIKKCSIDEISKYLLELGKKKDFPDITIRQ